MKSKVDYLKEEEYLPYHFSGRDFGAKSQKWIQETKFKKRAQKLIKIKILLIFGENIVFFLGEGSFYLVLIRSKPERGVGAGNRGLLFG